MMTVADQHAKNLRRRALYRARDAEKRSADQFKSARFWLKYARSRFERGDFEEALEGLLNADRARQVAKLDRRWAKSLRAK